MPKMKPTTKPQMAPIMPPTNVALYPTYIVDNIVTNSVPNPKNAAAQAHTNKNNASVNPKAKPNEQVQSLVPTHSVFHMIASPRRKTHSPTYSITSIRIEFSTVFEVFSIG